jgi:phosphoadenosine phosphosulfate reductase
MSIQEHIRNLSTKAKGLSAEDVIKLAHREFDSRVNFASSLGEEDQVITDMIARVAPQIEVFTLDTGRLYQETYNLLNLTQTKYPKLNYKIYFPDTKAVEEMVKGKGINLFYESIDNRKLCCGIRKVEPLRRALANVDAWITGLRREQAVTRSTLEVFEWDEVNQKIKINPLADWTLAQVHEYIKKHNVDVNPLHAQGFISIGCAPCTRAIKPGEDIRAGRWWWETPDQKECGLHNNPKRQQYLKEKKA